MNREKRSKKIIIEALLSICIVFSQGGAGVLAQPVEAAQLPKAEKAKIKRLFDSSKVQKTIKQTVTAHGRKKKAKNKAKGKGSAKTLNEKTIIVSVYASDNKMKWDPNSEKDLLTIANTQRYLDIAVKFLKKTCRKYGKKKTKFVYDWLSQNKGNDDLFYDVSFKKSIFKGNDYRKLNNYIKKNVPTAKLKKKYNAKSILYMVFVDTPDSWQNTSYTYANVDKDEGIGNEICVIQTRCDGEEEAPAAYAHEILHTFGAPDLYDLGGEPHGLGITDEIAAKYVEKHPNELMYTTFDPYTDETYYDRITNKVTELTAYYTGLKRSSRFAEKHHLDKSQY